MDNRRSVLRNEQYTPGRADARELVAGPGNADAGESLWHACHHPYRKRTSLTPEEVDRAAKKSVTYRAPGT